jgi:hypothetical protein
MPKAVPAQRPLWADIRWYHGVLSSRPGWDRAFLSAFDGAEPEPEVEMVILFHTDAYLRGRHRSSQSPERTWRLTTAFYPTGGGQPSDQECLPGRENLVAGCAVRWGIFAPWKGRFQKLFACTGPSPGARWLCGPYRDAYSGGVIWRDYRQASPGT